MKATCKIISLFFILIILQSIIKNTVFYSLYEYNNRVFTDLFCENTAQPELNCNGKCYMAKMKAEQAEQDKNNALNSLKQLLQESSFIGFFEVIPTHSFQPGTQNTVTPPPFFPSVYAFSYIHKSIKPPEFI